MSVYHSGNVSRLRGSSTLFGAPRSRWQDFMNLIAGLWLISAPWLMEQLGSLEYSNPGIATNMMGIGVVLIVMCVWALARPTAATPEWINMVCGAWLAAAPWALGFAGAMRSESIADCVIGLLVLVMAISASRKTRRAVS